MTYNRVRAHTMVPEWKFHNNCRIAEIITRPNVPGCVVECGVWKGGMSAGLFLTLGPERTYYLLDGFMGLPPAQEIDGASALQWQAATASPKYYNNCKASAAEASAIMEEVGCHDFHIIEGWLDDTLPSFDPGPIALLRLDVDWHEATLLCLNQLYGRVVHGGVIIFDDYDAWDGCRIAVDSFIGWKNISKFGDAYYHIKG